MNIRSVSISFEWTICKCDEDKNKVIKSACMACNEYEKAGIKVYAVILSTDNELKLIYIVSTDIKCEIINDIYHNIKSITDTIGARPPLMLLLSTSCEDSVRDLVITAKDKLNGNIIEINTIHYENEHLYHTIERGLDEDW